MASLLSVSNCNWSTCSQIFSGGIATFSSLHYTSNPDLPLLQILLPLQLLLPPVVSFFACSTQSPPSLLTPLTCSVTGAPQLLWWMMERAYLMSCPHPGPTLQFASIDACWKDRRSLSNCATGFIQHLPRYYFLPPSPLHSEVVHSSLQSPSCSLPALSSERFCKCETLCILTW